jgi:hypothetical protein
MFNNKVLDSGTLTADAPGNSVQSHGGRHVLQGYGTFGGGTLALQVLMPDGVTWVSVGPQNGVVTQFTANGSCVVYLCPGQYRVGLAGSAGASIGYAFGEANGP